MVYTPTNAHRREEKPNMKILEQKWPSPSGITAILEYDY